MSLSLRKNLNFSYVVYRFCYCLSVRNYCSSSRIFYTCFRLNNENIFKKVKMENCNSGKVSFDPGWNDPPKISYDATQTPPNRPRNFLNKRVAFPLSGVNASPVPVPSSGLPPMPTATTTSTARVMALGTYHQKTSSDVRLDSDSTREEVKNILLELLNNSCELGTKASDIKRRLDLMEQMWTDGKFNKDVQAQMKDLAYALQDNDPHKADAIHKALMVNHVSVVGTWMPGVKQLIHLCIARSELLAIDKD